MTVAQTIPPRNAVDPASTWNKESMYADTDAWQAEFSAVSAALPGLQAYAGTLGQGASRLADWMKTVEGLMVQVESLYFYAVMATSVDANDATARTLVGQVMGLYGQFTALTAFANPEILGIGQDVISGWVGQEARLKPYRKVFDDLFRRQPHIRSGEVEEVLGMLPEIFAMAGRSHSELSDTDMRFGAARRADGTEMIINQASLPLALIGADRTLRQTAWEGYMDGYLGMKNTLAAIYITSVKQNNFMARVRHYDNVLHQQLSPHNIPVAVFHNLIDTYRRNLPTWHRYWDVKRRALRQDDIRPFDIWAPLVSDGPQMTFVEAVEAIAAGMAPLGEEYVGVLRRGCLEERWVDYAVNEGKRQGAFSGGSYSSHPFIMMSYEGGLSGMSTLAHELGHSLHSYYSRKNQLPVFADYSMFVAEVASNFNQALTRAHLFEVYRDNPSAQIALIEEAMSNFHRYFFIMPTLARFEYEVHERTSQGQPMTADTLNQLMSDLFAEGYGTALTDDPARTGITWATFGHLYIPFYTFQYATGISAAHALANRILTGDDQARHDYLTFLATGSALDPIDALAGAGVDMTTSAAVEETFSVLADMVDRLEQLTS